MYRRCYFSGSLHRCVSFTAFDGDKECREANKWLLPLVLMELCPWLYPLARRSLIAIVRPSALSAFWCVVLIRLRFGIETLCSHKLGTEDVGG